MPKLFTVALSPMRFDWSHDSDRDNPSAVIPTKHPQLDFD